MISLFGRDSGIWLFNAIRGIENEAVKQKGTVSFSTMLNFSKRLFIPEGGSREKGEARNMKKKKERKRLARVE